MKNNDFTHGGDGIFVRALNGMCSEYNVFEGNDTSFANNNAVECGMGRNYWYNNKANWSSFGFWMGGSDENVMTRPNEMGLGTALCPPTRLRANTATPVFP